MNRYPRSVWAFALIFALIMSLPYLVGAVSTPDGWEYSGAAANPSGIRVDYNSHLAKMWQGSRGQWDYHLLFTHEDHPGLFGVQGFYVALGAVANVLPFGFPAVYHIAKFLLTAGMVLALWSFAAHFFEGNRERWLALLFGTLVAGWSWVLALIAPGFIQGPERAPIEFWLIDAYNSLGALYMPHFVAAIILQIVALLALDRWFESKNRREIIIMTLALAADAIIQPYVVLLIGPLIVMLAAYHMFSSHKLTIQQALWLVIPLGVHGLLVVYQYLIIAGDPIWAAFTAQNQTLSPDLIYYLLGYLPFILPIGLGARRFMLEQADDRWWLPILWVLIVAALLYAPFPTQRRYLLGVQTPLAVVAAYGWSNGVLLRLRPRMQPLVTGVFFIFAAIGPALMLVSNITALSNPQMNSEAFYTADEIAGYTWLRDNAEPDAIVLTTFDWSGSGSGGALVGATGLRVFVGHWIETVHFSDKLEQLQQFYDPETPDSWRQQFLTETGVDYIWYDDYARALGSWNPADAVYLEPVLSGQNAVNLYRTARE